MDKRSSLLPRARTDQLLSRELPDGVMIYDSERHHAHSLNAAATLIWQHCDGRTSVPELARLLEARLSLPADEELVWLALQRLEKAHLLEARLSRSPDGSGLTRRAVIRRLGLTSSLSLLLPVVTSMAAPAPARADSGSGGGQYNCCCYECAGHPDQTICTPVGSACPPAPSGCVYSSIVATVSNCSQCPDH